MVGMAGKEMTCTALHTEVVVAGPNKEILVRGFGRKQTRGMGQESGKLELQSSVQHCTVGSPTGYWRAGCLDEDSPTVGCLAGNL